MPNPFGPREPHDTQALFTRAAVVHAECVANLAKGAEVPADLNTRLNEAIDALRGEAGPFRHEYWSRSIPGALVETREPRLYHYLNDFPDPARGRLAPTFDAVDDLQAVALDSVRAPDRSAIVDKLTVVASDAMGLLDTIGIASLKGTPSLTADALDAEIARISARAESARVSLARCVRRTSQFEYALFMGISVVAILVVAGIVILIAQPPSGSQSWVLSMAAAFAAGGLGATTSVLSKLPKAEHVSADSGLVAFRLFGLVRPIVGALSGAAVYAIVAGGLLPLRPASGIELVFYAGLGFAAGSVEGFATGLIARAAPVTSPPPKTP